jgi:serine/threonine protein kinase HipA of HipAB toxin-antitoxin module
MVGYRVHSAIGVQHTDRECRHAPQELVAIYPDGRTPALAPAYDLLSTIPYIPDPTAALKYVRTKKMSEFTYDELANLAAKANLPEKPVLQTARETVEALLVALPRTIGIPQTDTRIEKDCGARLRHLNSTL